jgi:two-component system cell cycle sensor histidine kinase/response regulator CckA
MATATRLAARRAFRPVLTLLGIIGGLDLLLLGGMSVVAGTRAYVAGESMWAKGQKDAYSALLRYAETREPVEHARYERAVAIPLGDRRARLALAERRLDWREARDGLLQGGNHPDDITLMILLVRWGGWEPHIHRALAIWAEGDVQINRLVELAEALQKEGARGQPTTAQVASELAALDAVNADVTPLEREFSETLGDAARQVQLVLFLAIGGLSLALLLTCTIVMRRLFEQIAETTEGLQQNEARKSAMLDASFDAVLSMDAMGRIIEFSRAAEMMFGHQRDAVLGRELIDVIGPPEVRRRHKEGLARYLGGGEPHILGRRVKLEALRADGSRFAVEVAVARVATDGPALFTGFIRDLTDRKRDEVALRRYADIIEHMQLGLHVWQRTESSGPDGFRLVASNAAAAEATGVPTASVVGKTMRDGFPHTSDSILPAFYEEVLARGEAMELAEVQYGDDRVGQSTFAVKAFPLPDRSVAAIFENVTDRKRLEERLAQAQKLEIVGRLAGGVAHDFNNILTAVLGFGEVLQERLAEEGVAAPELVEILHAGERAKAVTAQLLAFSRKQMLVMAPLEVNALIERDARLIMRLIGEHITLTLHLAPDVGRVEADAAQLSQVLLNLAVNAADAMPNGGTLRIETSLVHDPAAGVQLQGGEWVLVRVADTGAGIDRDILPHIFEPFFTTKAVGKGSGLGLATVYGIVKQLGGEIAVDSAPERGTRFNIFLRPQVGTPREVAEAPPSGAGRRLMGSEAILLVEDEPSVRDLVRHVLAGHGYRVTMAASGEEALALAHPGTLAIDLLLTDAVMPGTSGPALAASLRQRYPALRVMLMSGFSEHPMLDAGPSDMRLLLKPFRPDELVRVVREHLDG